MIIATRQHTISCGHRVTGHESKCANFHGHNYTIETSLSAALDGVGRVLDFGVMKTLFDAWLEENWDHKFLLFQEDPWVKVVTEAGLPGFVIVNFNPTAENMAKFLHQHMFPYLVAHSDHDEDNIIIQGVRVIETPKCWAESIY